MRRVLLLLLVIVVLAAAVVISSRDPREPVAPEPADRAGGWSGEQIPPDRGVAPAAEISGTVWRGGSPVAARVELLAVSSASADDSFAAFEGIGPPLATTVASTGGAFRFRGLAVGAYELRATASDGVTGWSRVRIRFAGERVVAEVAIPNGPHTLRGRTVYADGRPFLGRVTFGREGQGRPGTYRARREDDSGRFVVTGLEPGLVRAHGLEEGSLRFVDRWVRIPFEGELQIVVDQRCVSLAGRVLAAQGGQPIEGAAVTARGDDGETGGIEVRVRTDDRGKFQLTVPKARRWLTVRAAGYATAELWVESDTQTVDIRLDRAGVVSGRVLAAEDGRPVAGVPVFWKPMDSYHPEAGGETRSDTAGRYEFTDMAVGPMLIFALGSGRCSTGFADYAPGGANPMVREVVPGRNPEVDLLVDAAVRLDGRVIDEDGEGVVGVPVEIGCGEDREPPGHPFKVVTGAKGSFSCESLLPGWIYWATAHASGQAPVVSPSLSGSVGEALEVTLTVPSAGTPARWLDLLVVEAETGDPIAGAKASAGRGATTGADGRCRIGPFGPGRVSVWVYHRDHLLLKNRPVLDLVPGVQSVTVRLRRGLCIAGRVLLPDGRPLENGTVWVQPVKADAGPDSSAIGEVTAGGSFRSGAVVAGRYKLKIGGTHDSGGYWVEAEVDAGAQDLVLTTTEYVGAPRRTLLLRVLDPSGRPVPAGMVTLRSKSEDGDWTEEIDILDGLATYEFWGKGGTVTVVAWGAKSCSGAPLPFGTARVGPVSREIGELKIRLPAERAIEGHIRTTDGRGIAGARLTATPVDLLDPDEPEGRVIAWSDANGAFRLSGLGDGAHRIEVLAPEVYLPVEERTAESGASDLEITVTRGISVRVTVVDPDGHPVAGAWAEFDESSAFCMTRGDGVATIDGLDPMGRGTLVISPPRSRTDLGKVRREGWSPADTRVVLDPVVRVSGVVRGPGGDPAPGAVVWSRQAGRAWESVRTAADGSFRVGPYPPGPVELDAVLSPGQAPDATTVTVEGGRADIVLTVEAGRTLTLRIPDWNPRYGPVQARLTGAGAVRFALVGSDGTVTFSGLPADATVGIFVGPVGDGLHVLRQDLGPDQSEVEARLVRGGELRGHVTLPAGAYSVTLTVAGRGYSLGGVVDKAGDFHVTGLPPGDCVVTVTARLMRRSLQDHCWTRPGETVELTLREE